MVEFVIAFVLLFAGVAGFLVAMGRKRPDRGGESDGALRARMTRSATR